ncbi:uncharacterized protein K441DRAFT_680863 [Cenococcum geophilum 1.58]|uniref:uncharacterized protein n=1 Tax=Cenococcum geophilum 1.58 TaxID=794803 RepID=UPI00358E696F|nr:hypothetical protein K441DRAFT_680863 [Cenococcum geophilum 1.58]
MPKNMPKRQKLAASGSPQKTSIPNTLQKPPTPPPEPINIEIIAYECVKMEADDDIDAVAQERLGKAVQSARLGDAGKELAYGNEAGRGLLGDVHEMKEMMKRMQSQLQTQSLQFVEHQAQFDHHLALINRLQHRVDILTPDAERYYSIRHRFIDVYRRDILRDVDREGLDRIDMGNGTAHEGDAFTDARLYADGKRNDRHALISLYGLTPNQLSSLPRDHPSMSTLNTGASWMKKGLDNIPADVAAAFQAFTTALRANLDADQSLTDGTTALSRAYLAFWAAHNRAPRRIRPRVVV